MKAAGYCLCQALEPTRLKSQVGVAKDGTTASSKLLVS
jgi:hypothetical protein